MDSPSVTRLLIARHGNTFHAGETVRRVGSTDLPLVPSGEEQAGKLGDYLRDNGMIPEVAYCSTLQRTRRTAEIIREVAGIPFSITPRSLFDEVDYGEDENKPESEVVARLGNEALRLWDEQAIVPEGWSVDTDAIMQGWMTFADEIIRQWQGKTVLVVTSNGVARFAPVITGDYEGFRAMHVLKLRTGALCIFEYDGSSEPWQCKDWGRQV